MLLVRYIHNQYIPCDQVATQSILSSSKITSLKPAVPSYRCLERILAKLRPHHPQLPHCCPQNTPLWHQGVSSVKTDPVLQAERTSTYQHSRDQTARPVHALSQYCGWEPRFAQQCRREMEHHSRPHLQLPHGCLLKEREATSRLIWSWNHYSETMQRSQQREKRCLTARGSRFLHLERSETMHNGSFGAAQTITG